MLQRTSTPPAGGWADFGEFDKKQQSDAEGEREGRFLAHNYKFYAIPWSCNQNLKSNHVAIFPGTS